jgi:hypothetical protein
MSSMRYLLVTHIPFALNEDGSALIDRLWAEDLKGPRRRCGSAYRRSTTSFLHAGTQRLGTRHAVGLGRRWAVVFRASHSLGPVKAF